MDGWIILDKPTGVFSKTAAAQVSKIFGTRKNGHIGTLDPMASGVLPIAIGNATKMIPFIEEIADNKKEYMFSMQFGFETDTLDITGKIIKQTNIVPDTDSVHAVLSKFIGEISQIPPAYSAVHINGKRAYDLARSGRAVDIPPRRVTIYELEFLGVRDKSWHFRMKCAPGTYVRSIARDIATELGTVATVDMIRRTQTTGFTLKNAQTLDFLKNLFNNGYDVGVFLAPIDLGLGDIPVLNLDNKTAKFYKNGGFVKTTGANGYRRVYSDNIFIGIGIVNDGVLRPKRTI